MSEQKPWLVPQEFYDFIMGFPDGADVTEHFEIDDPEWRTMKVTLFKTDDQGALLSVNSILSMEVAPEEGPA